MPSPPRRRRGARAGPDRRRNARLDSAGQFRRQAGPAENRRGDALLLDTHIALWLDSGDERLRPGTREIIDHCWQGGGTIFLSAVSGWEIAVLVDRGHIQLDLPPDRWLARFLGRPGLQPAPLEHGVAIRAYQLHHLEHRDPGDRLLIASAIDLGCPFVTYDERIRQFGRSRGRQYGFTLAE